MDKSDLSKIVRKHFVQEMADKLPQFEPQGGKGKISLAGWRSFLWTVADRLHFFIGLGVDAAGERFTVEGAWSSSPDYPSGESPSLLMNIKDEHLTKSQLVIRFGIRDQAGVSMEKPWWETHPAEEEDIEKLVADAVQHIQQEILPAFAKRASKLGVRLAL